MRKNKLLLLLVLLLTVAAGAWAQTEELLTTITPTDKDSYSETTPGVVTVTHDNSGHWQDYGWIWSQAGSVTVEAKDGYTITECVFRQSTRTPFTVSTAPFKAKFVEAHPIEERPEDVKYLCEGTDPFEFMDGVSSIEVYGYVTPAAATGYSITLDEGTGNKDSQNWEITPKSSELSGGEAVTVKYNGSREVKSVTVVKKGAAPKPDLLSSVFSVSASKKVNFSKGNLRYASSKWSFFDNQYDYYTSYSDDARDKFGWSTSAPTYGMNTSKTNDDYSGDFVDWGATMGTGWFTLSSDEWTYLFNTRSASTVGGTENGRYAKAKVNDVMGVILFPDTYTHPDGVTAPTKVNTTDASFDSNTYTDADWTKMESAGCVFLPAAGYRSGSTVLAAGSVGRYWSATPYQTGYAYGVYSYSSNLDPANFGNRYNGLSVRLVQAVDAPAPAYTLLSAATTDDIGKVVCAAGHLHDAKTAVPDGCTAVGILGVVTSTGHGLILALQNATSQTWDNINGWESVTTYAGTKLKVLPDDDARDTNLTSYTTLGETTVSNWAVAQKSDYEAIFTNLGSTTGDSDGMTYDANVNAYITDAGGTAISGSNWSATEDRDEANYACDFESEGWNGIVKTADLSIRPVLGF